MAETIEIQSEMTEEEQIEQHLSMEAGFIDIIQDCYFDLPYRSKLNDEDLEFLALMNERRGRVLMYQRYAKNTHLHPIFINCRYSEEKSSRIIDLFRFINTREGHSNNQEEEEGMLLKKIKKLEHDIAQLNCDSSYKSVVSENDLTNLKLIETNVWQLLDTYLNTLIVPGNPAVKQIDTELISLLCEALGRNALLFSKSTNDRSDPFLIGEKMGEMFQDKSKYDRLMKLYNPPI